MRDIYVIAHAGKRLFDAFEGRLDQSVGKPVDFATASFLVSGYEPVKDGPRELGPTASG